MSPSMLNSLHTVSLYTGTYSIVRAFPFLEWYWIVFLAYFS